MSPKLFAFLSDAATCDPDMGMPIGTGERRIASSAVDKGYGDTWGFGGLSRFIISDAGRAAIKGEAK